MYEGGDYNGLLILPPESKNGDDIKPLLGLDDYIFDISITANRPDCQSVLGIAREVAAVLGKKLKEPDCSYTAVNCGDKVKISDLAPEVCPRYIGHLVKDVKNVPTPAYMKRRLALSGIRSISCIVDITNYVLLEMGQPMHAFDFGKLEGGEIIIRRAENGEKITTLDNNEFTLKSDNLVICDAKKPCALAGIMGGLNSEITDETKDVLFECAKFARDSVRKTARALGQHSDSSALFEKGVNEYTVEKAMQRALHLIEELKCGTVTSVHVDVKTKYSNSDRKKLTVSAQKINSLLGIEVPVEKMTKILKDLNFGVQTDGDAINLTVPAYREDIDGFPDIAEEIIRFYGYDNIEGTFLPSATITNGGYNEEQKAENKLKNMLVGKGLYEISTYSFYSVKDLDMLHYPEDCAERKTIKILNPISEELSVMRTTLAPSMINTVVRNLRRGNMQGKLFELAKVYLPEELPLKSFPEEKKRLCISAWGKSDFFEVKGIVECVAKLLNTSFEFESAEKPFLHPGMTAKISCDGEEIGYMGVLAPTVATELAIDRAVVIAELDYEELKKHAKPFRYVPIPKFAEVTRDLALVCEQNITCGEI
ncbi:MAG TPA: phenylalanine--tRNA ligase subunit beta, partial [Clostridiales bacterium]|nr:phenylalanine--tRNA ligase subunit beta [Clostridiales bacterium]